MNTKKQDLRQRVPGKHQVLNKCLREEKRKEGAHSRLQPGRYQTSYKAARPSWAPVWTKTCNILGPH